MGTAVIFDMDGVIFDSERAVYNCWLEVAKRHGVKDLESAYFRTIGTTKAATRELYLDFYGQDFPYDIYSAEVSTLYHSRHDDGRLPIKAGIRELLTILRDRDSFIAVASSTRSAVVTAQLKAAGLLSFFDRIVGGDMITRSKPDPEIFLKAAEGCGIPNHEIYVVEDSYNGIRAAAAAGMLPVMIPDMLPPNDEMKAAAACIFKDLNEFRDFLFTRA